MKKKSVVLIGMAGVGKSTIGKQLAHYFNYKFIDLDEYIIDKCGWDLQDIIDEKGDHALIKIEGQCMIEVPWLYTVIAPGGSIVYSTDVMEQLTKKTTIVYLDDLLENIANRTTNKDTRGIVGLKHKTFEQVFYEREKLYMKYAEVIIECHNRMPNQIVQDIIRKLSKYGNN